MTEERKRIKHKTEGWTGTIEVVHEGSNCWSSHGVQLTVTYQIKQDAYKPNGEYVEDPRVSSLEELEFI